MDHLLRENGKTIHFTISLVVLCVTVLSGCTGQAASSSAALVTEGPPIQISIISDGASPSTTRTPIYAISGGQDLLVSTNDCVDLDSGNLLGLNDPQCDFAIMLPENNDHNSVRFIPLSYASFAFNDVFWDLPDSKTCSMKVEYTAEPQWINTIGGYYVCFQTGQEHWGILNVKGMSGDDLLIYWITYPDRGELIAVEPAQYPTSEPLTVSVRPAETSVPEEVFSQGTNIWVNLDQGVDLDTGVIQAGWNGNDDLVVSAGEIGADGSLLGLQLEPVGKAGIQTGTGFESAPLLSDCLQEAGFQTEPLQVGEVHLYRCFQTSEGRLGYVYIHESSPGVGIRLDWTTWPDVKSSFTKPATMTTPLESGTAAELVIPAQLGGVKVYRPGQLFSFTWQLKNTGKTTWNTRYALVFAGGTALGGLEKKWIPYLITPGMTVRLALSLAAPQIPGTYTALYWLVDDTGQRFGIGENGSRPLQLVINAGEPGLTLADGQGVTLAPGTCFDLDLGYPAVDDSACDFSVSESQDPEMVQISSSQAAFDFDTLFSSPPRLGQCKTARLSGGRRVLDLQDWYICYRTTEGRYGWLKIRDLSSDSLTNDLLLFDWKTYQ